MDTFIVRFYRRTLKPPQELAGTVERVGSGERAGFADANELLERLLRADEAPAPDDEGDPRRAADQRMDGLSRNQ
jgi:hypothetical protein